MGTLGNAVIRPGSEQSRFLVIDAWRGFAILLMVVYHFCFDLGYFGLAEFNFYQNPFWLHSRTFILGQFLLLVGISLVLATQRGINVGRFLRRLGWLVASAAFVSVSTWWMFGDRLVVFGVLHFIAVASVVGLLFAHHYRLSLMLGIILIVTGNLVQSSWFDQPGWNWIGMMSYKPATEDYVPLLPWFGVVLLGISAAGMLTVPVPGNNGWLRLLALPGRHSLLIYMLHQPVLMGLLYAWVKLG